MLASEPKVWPTFAEVSLHAGGDHRFDLTHLRRQGAERLVRLLLQLAGYRKQLPWRVRVEKKIACGAETRAVTIVGSKPWCCYLKIKPGDNNTAHFCSLLMPDGHQGEKVYQDLKDVEEQINMAWRRGLAEKVVPVDNDPENNGADEPAEPSAGPLFVEPPAQTNGAASAAKPAAVAPSTEAEEEAAAETEPSELLGWTNDPDKTRLTLLAIREVGQEGKTADLDEFVAVLTEKLGWQGLRRKQIGGIFTALVRRGNILRVKQGSLPLSYALTAEGEKLIQDLIDGAAPAPAPAAPSPVPARVERPTGGAAPAASGFAAALTEAARGYTAASEKLQTNRTRRAQLVAEIERLDAEAQELSKVVANPEIQALLAKLLQLTGTAAK